MTTASSSWPAGAARSSFFSPAGTISACTTAALTACAARTAITTRAATNCPSTRSSSRRVAALRAGRTTSAALSSPSCSTQSATSTTTPSTVRACAFASLASSCQGPSPRRPVRARTHMIPPTYAPPCADRGTVSSTRTGQRCQPWTDQTPHAHAYVHAVYPDAGLGAHSYCRNPGHAEPTAWCMPQNPSRERELCDVGEPRRNCRRWQLLKELRAAAAADPSVSAAGMLPLSLGIASPGTGLHKTPALLQMAQGERPEARHPYVWQWHSAGASTLALASLAALALALRGWRRRRTFELS